MTLLNRISTALVCLVSLIGIGVVLGLAFSALPRIVDLDPFSTQFAQTKAIEAPTLECGTFEEIAGLNFFPEPIEDAETWNCGLPELFTDAEENRACRWNHSPVRFGADLSRIASAELARTIVSEVAAMYTEACGADVVVVDQAAGANIWGTTGSMARSTLGYAYLPCGGVTANTRLGQVYNVGLQWSPDMLRKVVLHEMGHSMGLGHSASTSDIMFPTLGANTRYQFGPGDIRELTNRYGPPKPPTPTPEPPAPDNPQPPADGPGLRSPDCWIDIGLGDDARYFIPTYREPAL